MVFEKSIEEPNGIICLSDSGENVLLEVEYGELLLSGDELGELGWEQVFIINGKVHPQAILLVHMIKTNTGEDGVVRLLQAFYHTEVISSLSDNSLKRAFKTIYTMYLGEYVRKKGQLKNGGLGCEPR